jgi:hypothetical protein
VRMRRKKRRSSGSGIPEAGGMTIRPLPALSAAHHHDVLGALRGVPAEVGREKTLGLRLPRWGGGVLPPLICYGLLRSASAFKSVRQLQIPYGELSRRYVQRDVRKTESGIKEPLKRRSVANPSVDRRGQSLP